MEIETGSLSPSYKEPSNDYCENRCDADPYFDTTWPMDMVKYFQEGTKCDSCQKKEYNSFFDSKIYLQKCPCYKPCQEEWDMMVEILNYDHFNIGGGKKSKISLDVQQSSHEHLTDIVEFPFPCIPSEVWSV
jgi:hypothetical protein